MPLVLEHLRNMPRDLPSLEYRFKDSVSALVGCVATSAMRETDLDDGCILDLVARASHRVDEVILMASLRSETQPTALDNAERDALSALKMALDILSDSWNQFPRDERRRMLGIALHSLARFCYVSRSADHRRTQRCPDTLAG